MSHNKKKNCKKINNNLNQNLIITTNKNRREDFKKLAKIRIQKGVRYSSLKLVFSFFCMHCSDLEPNKAKEEIEKFGKTFEIKDGDIESQYKYTYKPGRLWFDINGQNRYKYSNTKIVEILHISKEEAQYLDSIYKYKVIDDEIIQKNFNDSDIEEKINNNEENINKENSKNNMTYIEEEPELCDISNYLDNSIDNANNEEDIYYPDSSIDDDMFNLEDI